MVYAIFIAAATAYFLGNFNGAVLVSAMLYKLAAALMQPVSDGPLASCIHDFSRVLMLLFIIQLCAAAMFLMLIAQLIGVSSLTFMMR